MTFGSKVKAAEYADTVRWYFQKTGITSPTKKINYNFPDDDSLRREEAVGTSLRQFVVGYFRCENEGFPPTPSTIKSLMAD